MLLGEDGARVLLPESIAQVVEEDQESDGLARVDVVCGYDGCAHGGSKVIGWLAV